MLQYWCNSLYKVSGVLLSPKIKLKAGMEIQIAIFKQIENFLQNRTKITFLPVFPLWPETEPRTLLVARKPGVLLGLICESRAIFLFSLAPMYFQILSLLVAISLSYVVAGSAQQKGTCNATGSFFLSLFMNSAYWFIWMMMVYLFLKLSIFVKM